MSPLPLDLSVEVTAAGGARYRWDSNQDPGSRPQGLGWRTKIGEGSTTHNSNSDVRVFNKSREKGQQRVGRACLVRTRSDRCKRTIVVEAQ